MTDRTCWTYESNANHELWSGGSGGLQEEKYGEGKIEKKVAEMSLKNIIIIPTFLWLDEDYIIKCS